jgi:hypothetical protein
LSLRVGAPSARGFRLVALNAPDLALLAAEARLGMRHVPTVNGKEDVVCNEDRRCRSDRSWVRSEFAFVGL